MPVKNMFSGVTEVDILRVMDGLTASMPAQVQHSVYRAAPLGRSPGETEVMAIKKS